MADDGLLEALDPVVPGGPRDQADEAFVGGVDTLDCVEGWATELLIEEWVASCRCGQRFSRARKRGGVTRERRARD